MRDCGVRMVRCCHGGWMGHSATKGGALLAGEPGTCLHPPNIPLLSASCAQEELAASMWQHGLQPVVAPVAHYGRPQDAPAQPTVFAGQEFR